MTTEQVIQVDGMSCTGCGANIERALSRMDGVESVSPNHQAATVRIVFDPDRVSGDAISERITEIGYSVRA